MNLYPISFYSSIMTFWNSIWNLPLAHLSFSVVSLKFVLAFIIEYATEGWNNLFSIFGKETKLYLSLEL